MMILEGIGLSVIVTLTLMLGEGKFKGVKMKGVNYKAIINVTPKEVFTIVGKQIVYAVLFVARAGAVILIGVGGMFVIFESARLWTGVADDWIVSVLLVGEMMGLLFLCVRIGVTPIDPFEEADDELDFTDDEVQFLKEHIKEYREGFEGEEK